MFEARHGVVTAVSPIRHRQPVEAYLSRQGRYAHLFGDAPRPDVIAHIQEAADRTIARYGLVTDDGSRTDGPG